MMQPMQPGMQEDFDPASLAGLTQEELNARLLAATLKQGSRSGEQMMMADQLRQADGAKPLGPRGRGMIGEINDAMTASRPGMARGQAQQMMQQQRLQDQKFMANIMRGGAPKPESSRYWELDKADYGGGV